MKTINREELQARLSSQQPIQLWMALDLGSFNRQHIPGSVAFADAREAAQCFSPDQDVVIYDSNAACPASYRAYYYLRSQGFQNIYRYAGGLEDWTAAGNPVEGLAQA